MRPPTTPGEGKYAKHVRSVGKKDEKKAKTEKMVKVEKNKGFGAK